MRFFITAETYKTVGEKLRLAINQVESKIKGLVSEKNYGNGVSYWGYIAICCPKELYEKGFFKEIKKYTKKKTEVELRLRVDYDLMVKANGNECLNLLCYSILQGIEIAENELKIEDFDFETFREDIMILFKKQGWLKV